MTEEEKVEEQVEEEVPKEEPVNELAEARKTLQGLRTAKHGAEFVGTPAEIAKKRRWYNLRIHAAEAKVIELKQKEGK